ncbi:MAG: hypothetical protein CFE31_10310 [Rhizobiales bacterium PAR1]|nr:MAG: hypothetical protein CFE31_10310 [Rhizobiales bacterium PAR1]
MDIITPYLIPLLQIIWIDLLLSGDNAVVIALACRGLPPEQRKMGILLGTAVAIVLRILFALIISSLLNIPFLKAVGGLMLFWVAFQLIKGEDEAHGEVAQADNLWKAVRTIAIADAVMSLDNVLALAAASKGNMGLFIFGLLITLPLIIYGSQLVLGLIERFPIFVWLGAALLGWIAGELIADDPGLQAFLGKDIPNLLGAAVGAFLVLITGFLYSKRRRKLSPDAP